MIVFGSIIISILVCAFLFWKYKSRLLWWEALLMLAITTGAAFGSKAIVERMNLQYDEWWGSTVTELYEEEPWNEWIHQTCTETYACGTDLDGNTQYCTRTYDCSYQADYSADYYVRTTSDEVISITEQKYEEILKIIGPSRTSIKTRRNHSANSTASASKGSKHYGKKVGKTSEIFRTTWDRKYNSAVPVITEHSYINKIKASDYTIFNFSEVSEQFADSLKLYDYPKFKKNYFDYPTILGLNNLPNVDSVKIQKELMKVNGLLGATKEVRIWMLLFDGGDFETGIWQEHYWVGGNKNELVICAGVTNNKIKWTHVFSWSEREDCKEHIKGKLSRYKVANDSTLMDFTKFVYNETNANFDRRHFETFDYLKVDPPLWAIILVYVIALLVNVGVGIWVVKNEFTDDDPKGYGYSRYSRFRI